jgi:hypothetical protein
MWKLLFTVVVHAIQVRMQVAMHASGHEFGSE